MTQRGIGSRSTSTHERARRGVRSRFLRRGAAPPYAAARGGKRRILSLGSVPVTPGCISLTKRGSTGERETTARSKRQSSWARVEYHRAALKKPREWTGVEPTKAADPPVVCAGWGRPVRVLKLQWPDDQGADERATRRAKRLAKPSLSLSLPWVGFSSRGPCSSYPLRQENLAGCGVQCGRRQYEKEALESGVLGGGVLDVSRLVQVG